MTYNLNSSRTQNIASNSYFSDECYSRYLALTFLLLSSNYLEHIYYSIPDPIASFD
jgi:hypothetical protein